MRYFVIIDKDTLNSEVPQIIAEPMGYPKGIKLIDCVLSHRELEDGRFAVSVNLANAKRLPNKCAKSNLTDSELELAKMMYGEHNLLSKSEYFSLDFANFES